MQRALVAMIGLGGACGFSSNSVPAMPGSAAAMDAGTDTAVPDATSMPENHRRKLITFDTSKIAATQTDFPAWIDLVDPDIAARAQANGSDLYFTAADGSALDHELQLADLAGHHFAAWVRIPSLSKSPATTIYVHYGDPAAAPASRPVQVFKSSFAAVWHLDDALPATTIADATGRHPGTPHLTGATTRTTGRLGSALAFTGADNDRIDFTNPLTGNNPHTISVWVDQGANLTRTASIISMGNTTTGNARWLHGHFSPTAGAPSSLAAGFYSLDFNPNPVENLDGMGPTYIVWVFEGANKKNHLYRNGTEIAAGVFMPAGNTINTTGTAGFIGYAPAPAYGALNTYIGTIDELRIATAARTPEWIATEYANQHTPATFYSVGPELTP